MGEVRRPARHLFTSGELAALVERAGCRVLEMVTTPCLGAGLPEKLEEIAQDPVAWSTLVELEARAGALPGMLDVGEHLIAAVEVGAPGM